MSISLLLLIIVLNLFSFTHALSTKGLSSQCLCDISDACDANCCCDKECSSTAKQTWNRFDSCYNPGLPIPMCSQYEAQPFSTSDLYHGLSLIYTIVRRLFCISKINFADQTTDLVSKTTDSQFQTLSASISQVNPNIASLASISNFPSLPRQNSMGSCSAYPLKDMNNIVGQRCRVFINSLADYATNSFLSVSAFKTSNPTIDATKLKVYTIQAASSPTPTSVFASTITSTCASSPCTVIRQIQFFFIKSSASVVIDYASSYLVTGSSAIDAPSFISLIYSYQFKPSASSFPSTSVKGYTIGSHLNFLQSVKTANTTTYYKMMNPVNLGFVTTAGLCSNSTNTTQLLDQGSLVYFRLGVNTVVSCLGSNSELMFNLNRALRYVSFQGSSSSVLNDYAEINYASDSTVANSTSQDIKITFYYVKIGTENDPQYRITSAAVRSANDFNQKLQTLYIEYMQLSSAIKLNIPNPPTINAYLPDDFLYPFYVAS